MWLEISNIKSSIFDLYILAFWHPQVCINYKLGPYFKSKNVTLTDILSDIRYFIFMY